MNSTVKTSGPFSKSKGLRASVPFFSLPHPLPSTFLLSPSRDLDFVRLARERLLRRLSSRLLIRSFRVFVCMIGKCTSRHLFPYSAFSHAHWLIFIVSIYKRTGTGTENLCDLATSKGGQLLDNLTAKNTNQHPFFMHLSCYVCY